jgi:hypothetical protein
MDDDKKYTDDKGVATQTRGKAKIHTHTHTHTKVIDSKKYVIAENKTKRVVYKYIVGERVLVC